MSQDETNDRRFTEAVKSDDYKEDDDNKKKVDPFESTNQQTDTPQDETATILGMPNVAGRSPETQKIFTKLQDEKALAVRDIGLAKEIVLNGKKYTRNVMTSKIRDRWVLIEEALANARYKNNFASVEWQAVKEKVKLLWGIIVEDNMDTEELYRISEASDIVVQNRFR